MPERMAELIDIISDAVEPFMLPPRRAQADRISARVIDALAEHQDAVDAWLEELARAEKEDKG